MTERMQCGFHFGPGVRCLMVDGHDQPYYPYLDHGQTGEYSNLLSRGTPHQVVEDPPEVPPREQWTGNERRDSLPRWPQFKPPTHSDEPARCVKCGGPAPFHDPACIVHPGSTESESQ